MTEHFPPDFITQMSAILPSDELEAFLASLSQSAPVSRRYHHSKGKGVHITNSIAWCKEAEYLQERPIFTIDPLWHAGQYYVQEASSMLISYVLRQICNGNKELKILDLCAAPGGKSTCVLDYLQGEGLLVSNEVIQSRVRPLMDNIIRWGCNNAVVTNNDPKDFRRLPGYFDVILVDAPCSGEGMFRKDNKAAAEWSLDDVNHCANRQKRVVEDAYQALRPGGLMIYSTCTYNPTENIDNVAYFANQLGLHTTSIAGVTDFGIQEITKDGQLGYQCYPHKLNGEGFFISLLRKEDSYVESEVGITSKLNLNVLNSKEYNIVSTWLDIPNKELMIHHSGDIYHYNSLLSDEINALLTHLNVRYSGVKCGKLQKELFLPDHALAMISDDVLKENRVALTKSQALQYLSKSLDQLPKDTSKGWCLVTYEELCLGWVKNIGNRINNYLPNEYRIRMDISPYL